jgi:hypothetical protein
MTHVFRTRLFALLGMTTAIVLLAWSTTTGQPPERGIKKKHAGALSAEALKHLAERALPNFKILSLTPPLIVSPAFPYKDGQAYFRADATTASIILDAHADGLLISAPPAGKNLDVFVHGMPNKATLIDCTIDLETGGSLEATYRGGANDASSVPDPQGRKATVTSAEGHFVFAVPGDLPLVSSTNWFSLRVALPATGALTFYGCAISIAA